MLGEGATEGLAPGSTFSWEHVTSDSWDGHNAAQVWPEVRKPRTANNPFAQAQFDCRDILLPKGKGKDGQRRRVNLRALLFTIATQGEWSNTPKGRRNGLWWPMDRIAARNGIGIHQAEALLNWLVEVGLVRRKRQFNRPSILWVNFTLLREICQRQQDDREAYQNCLIIEHESNAMNEVGRNPEYDPEDMEEIYFPKESSSEAPPEATQ